MRKNHISDEFELLSLAGMSSTASCGTSWKRWWRRTPAPPTGTKEFWSASSPAAANLQRKRRGRREGGRGKRGRTGQRKMAAKRQKIKAGRNLKGECDVSCLHVQLLLIVSSDVWLFSSLLQTKGFAGEGGSGIRSDQRFPGLTGAAQQEASPDLRGRSASRESKRFQHLTFTPKQPTNKQQILIVSFFSSPQVLPHSSACGPIGSLWPILGSTRSFLEEQARWTASLSCTSTWRRRTGKL